MTKDKDSHSQMCCNVSLTTIEDYIGGGSHYWVLQCDVCKQKYTYDTYRFELEIE